MRFAGLIAVAVLLYRARPDLFTLDATGFRTLAVFSIVTVVLVIIPGRR